MKRLLFSAGWMGSASLLGSVAGAIRAKAFAVLLGPAGFGLYGLLQSLQGFLNMLADLGLGGAAAREIALERDDPGKVAGTFRIALRAALALGALAAALLVACRRPLARLLLGGDEHAGGIAVLAIGLLAAALAGARFSLLVGLGRVRRNAMTRIGAVLAGTVVAVLVVWRWREAGVPWAIAAGPLALLAAVWVATGLLPARERPPAMPLTAALPMIQMGAVIILSPLLRSLRETAARGFLQHHAGLVAVAEYHAATTLSMLAIAFLLASLYPDFYPRVARRWHSPADTRRRIDEQIRFSLLLAAAPVLLLQSFPEAATRLFYSGEFALAPEILRWHLCGAFPRIVGWTLSTALFAGRRLRAIALYEAARGAVHLAVLVVAVRAAGVVAAGPAFFVSYLLTLPLAIALLRRHCGERLLRPVWPVLVPLQLAAVASAALATWLPGNPWASYLVAGAAVGWALARVRRSAPSPRAEPASAGGEEPPPAPGGEA